MKTTYSNSFPTWEQYLEFKKIILSVGFRKMTKHEIGREMFRLGVTSNYKITGREVCFIFSYQNGYSVKICTSVLEEEKKLRDVGTDAGWVIIVKGDKLVYSARCFLRTGDFFLRLARYGWIAKWKIENTPFCPCPGCFHNMYIYRKSGTRQYMWRCDNLKKHLQPTFREWDYGLGPKAKSFLEIRRVQTRKRKKKNDLLGLKPIPKAVTRKKWNIKNPEDN